MENQSEPESQPSEIMENQPSPYKKSAKEDESAYAKKRHEIQRFRGQDYQIWSRQAFVILDDLGFWDAVESGTSDPQLDNRAWCALIDLVDRSWLSSSHPECTVATASAKDVWYLLQETYNPIDVLAVFNLEKQLAEIKLDGSMDEYLAAKIKIFACLQGAGSPMEEAKKVAHLLSGLPSDFKAFIALYTAIPQGNWDSRAVIKALKNFGWSPAKQETFRRSTSHRSYAQVGRATPKPQAPTRPCRHCGELHWDGECPLFKAFKDRWKSNKPSSNYWIADSGASFSMTNDPQKLINALPISGSVIGANGHPLHVRATGTVNIGKTMVNGVRLVPELDQQLFSIVAAVEDGCQVHIDKEKCTVFKNGEPIITASKEPHKGGLFIIDQECNGTSTNKNHTFCLLGQTAKENLQTAHRRLGHISAEHILELVSKNLVEGISISDKSMPTCQTCPLGKTCKSKQTKLARRQARHVGDIISADVIGPIKPTSNGARYISMMIDHYSSYASVMLIKTKSTESLLDHIIPFLN